MQAAHFSVPSAKLEGLALLGPLDAVLLGLPEDPHPAITSAMDTTATAIGRRRRST
jgi:hypothetical protein